ncbi:MAG: dihydrofolate reductase family protein [Spirochaetota bacterium]
MKVSVYIATSVDGFIAGPQGEIDWLHDQAYTIAGEDFGYAEFMSGVDAIVMGYNTFVKVLEFPEWPFGKTPVYVLTASERKLPQGIPARISLETPAEITARLRLAGLRRIYVDGGKLISSFLSAQLVTDITITRVPVLLGQGIPLFSGPGCQARLKHLSTNAWANGFAQSRYEVC